MSAERRRLARGLLFSVLAHGLLLSLMVGGQGLGLPGLGLPWQVRRAELPELHVVLAPAQATAAEPLPAAPVAPPAADGAVLTAAMAPDATPLPTPTPALIALRRSGTAPWFVPPTVQAASAASAAEPSASSVQGADSAMLPLRDAVGDAAQERSNEEARERALQLASLDRAMRDAQQQADAQEAARQDAARAETARLAAEQLAAARQEAVRQETARQDALRTEAARLEATRLAAAQAARLEAARAEAARLDDESQAAARQIAARQAAALAEAAALRDAKLAAAQAEGEQREARLRAIGRQLDEEADRRAASSGARRGRLFGRTDANAELVLYAEAWSRKLQLNMTFDMIRDAARQPHTDPMVTVAVRSDGSVESVSFVRSSGVAAIDEAIRRIVHSQANYPAFPPPLAREFDVVEIRRSWHFDMAIRLY